MKIIDEAKHSTRNVLNLSSQVYRGATSSLRLLPDFLIIGAQRCGTTSLYYYLTEHPLIGPSSVKEVHFFDDGFTKGMRWYRAQFPTILHKYYCEHIRRDAFFTGEATPSYLLHPHAPKRIAQVLPKVKLIVLLRNPVERAYSQHWLRTTLGDETLSFEDAIRAEEERIAGEQEMLLMDEHSRDTYRRFSYLSRGRYVDQLQRWMSYYPREQFLLLQSEDFYRDPGGVTKQVFQFIGVPAETVKIRKAYKQYRLGRKTGYRNQEKPPALDSKTRKHLLDYFQPYNARLYELVGRNFGWEE